MKRILTLGLALLMVFALSALVACTPDEDEEEVYVPEVTTEAPALDTLTPGYLTIATGQPAFSPWVENDDPESGQGFEAAVAYAVADRLGFSADQVVWVRTDFEAAIAPGPKDFDFNLQQFSITEERAEVVDFSSPYFVSPQAIVALEDGDFANAASIADLQGATIGAASGSTSLIIAQEHFGEDVAVFNDVDAAVQALRVGQVDAIINDLPSALFTKAVQLYDEGGVLVGSIYGSDEGAGFGLLLPKDSPLTDPVSEAVDALRADGTLDALAEQWLISGADGVILR
jgi:polar amino acid transport system substrate-binding protein